MEDLNAKLRKWAKSSATVTFFGTLYTLKSVKDPNNWASKSSASKGRNSLASDILARVDELRVRSALVQCQTDPKPDRFLAILEATTAIESPEAKYFRHYDRCSTKFFKRLSIRHHIKSRESGCDFIIWRGNEYHLTDVETQVELFDFILENYTDPMCFRLAVAPQFWSRLLDDDFDKMMKVIGYKYRSMLYGPRKNPIDWKVFFKSLYAAIQSYDDLTLKRYLFLVLRYSMFMYREHGVQLEIPKLFLKNGSEFNAKIFKSKYFIKFLVNWSYSRLNSGLQYGLVSNPWLIFDEIFEHGMIDDGNLVFNRYSFLEDIDPIVERFHVERIWNG